MRASQVGQDFNYKVLKQVATLASTTLEFIYDGALQYVVNFWPQIFIEQGKIVKRLYVNCLDDSSMVISKLSKRSDMPLLFSLSGKRTGIASVCISSKSTKAFTVRSIPRNVFTGKF
jgi:hypothetical protein